MTFFVLLLQKGHKTVTTLEHGIWGKQSLCALLMITHIWLQN